jgi:hypothetical protein
MQTDSVGKPANPGTADDAGNDQHIDDVSNMEFM